MPRVIGLAALVLAGLIRPAFAAGWPAVDVPSGSRLEVVAGEVLIDGKRSRVLRLFARGSIDELASFYKEFFGSKHVDNTVGGRRVIASQQGGFFETVEIRQLDAARAQATILITDLDGGNAQASQAGLDTERLLPPSSAVLSNMQSNDDGRHSLTLVGANRLDVKSNRDHMLAALKGRGFRLVKEDLQSAPDSRDAVLLLMSSKAEEVAVTITDAGLYRSIVINRTRDNK